MHACACMSTTDAIIIIYIPDHGHHGLLAVMTVLYPPAVDLLKARAMCYELFRGKIYTTQAASNLGTGIAKHACFAVLRHEEEGALHEIGNCPHLSFE